jgi:hypothetical protein
MAASIADELPELRMRTQKRPNSLTFRSRHTTDIAVCRVEARAVGAVAGYEYIYGSCSGSAVPPK